MANLDWYKKRGLTKTRTVTFTEDSITVKLGKGKPGDTIEVEEPTERYSCGRIDIRGREYDSEMGVPPMRAEHWNRFGDWLMTFETDGVWTLKQLVEVYERTNPKIEWWQDKEIKSKCDRMIAAMVGDNNIESWWDSRNKAFEMRTANEQFDINPNVVYDYLLGHIQR